MRLLALVLVLALARAAAAQSVVVTLPASAKTPAEGLQGRLLFLVSTDTAGEPRFQIDDTHGTKQVFGVDVTGWRPGQSRAVDAAAFGYPVASLAALRPGSYRVQALLNAYETFRRGDGFTVSLPPDRGEGQQWSRKPGNSYSRPQAARIAPGRDRKSTRLNSSHTVISYAVFCLKKKKKKKKINKKNNKKKTNKNV